MTTIESIKRAAPIWFSPDTLRFFRSRVGSKVYEGPGGVYFVTSEQGPHGPRRWSVRRFLPDKGAVDTVGEFQAYQSLAGAYGAARKLSAAPPVPAWVKRLAHDVVDRTGG